MQLIIAEKPSVAQSIAAVLGVKSRRDGYLEGGGYLVSWCLGHLAGLAPADAYDPAYSKWELAGLPILPQRWQFTLSPEKRGQFDTLAALMAREDVERLVCATDAGREGELIFRLVYQEAGCQKPFTRLWISSMEDAAIRAGFEALRPGADYDRLFDAALCRAKADWLVGINATRLFSCLYHRTLNVGRVMTPTLALVVEREDKIAHFKKEKFYTVELDCGDFKASGGRLQESKAADRLRAACGGQTATVTAVERRDRAERPPRLYDLTTLQRDGNRIFGYTAQQVLDYAQALYEKKLLTYPRTDAQFLTEDTAPTVPGLVEAAAKALPCLEGAELTVNAAQVVDGSKVSDHHALLPTAQLAHADLAALPAGERNVLTLAAVRLVCAVAEKHVAAETALTLACGGETFTAKGRTVLSQGWRAVQERFDATLKHKPEADAAPSPLPDGGRLPELQEGAALPRVNATVKEGATAPPKHFTEDSLLAAMENADAEEFAQIEEVERKGLGTPATRAGVLEKLVKGGFLERKGRQLLPTQKGVNLIVVLPEAVKSAKLTAEWEAALKEVERGERPAADFMAGIEELTRELVAQYSAAQADAALFQEQRESIGKCPRCGADVVEGKQNFHCASRECGFVMWKDDRFFQKKRKALTKKVAAALLKTGKVKMTGLFSEEKGVLYDATVVLADTGGKYVNFRLEFPDKSKKGGKQ